MYANLFQWQQVSNYLGAHTYTAPVKMWPKGPVGRHLFWSWPPFLRNFGRFFIRSLGMCETALLLWCPYTKYWIGKLSFCRPKISNQILDRAAESLSTLTQNKSYYDCLKGVSKIWKSWAEVFGSRKFKSKKKKF